MLELIIDEPIAGLSGPPFDPDSRDFDAWYDQDGELFAHGYRLESTHWLEVPEVGTFRFGPEAPTVVATPMNGVSREVVSDTYFRLVLPNALQALGHEVLHASGVITPRGVVAFCANRRVGKSTMGYALSTRGYPLWADDAVALEFQHRSIESPFLPFRLRLRPPSASFFGSDARGAVPAAYDDRGPEQRAPLAVIFVLEQARPSAGSQVELSRVARRDAFSSLLRHAYSFTPVSEERRQQMMSRYLELSDLVPTFRVRFIADFRNLDMILDQLEQVLMGLETRG
jgi:hypothetical protein